MRVPLRFRFAVTTSLVALAASTPLWATSARADVPCHQPYYIATGETLQQIAARCGTTIGDIMRANPKIEDPTILPVGYALQIPSSGYVATAPRRTVYRSGSTASSLTPRLRRVSWSTGEYQVQPGDTLLDIANAFNLRVSELLAANPQLRNPDELYSGELLRLPGNFGDRTYREARFGDVDVIPYLDRGEANFAIRAQNFPANAPVRITVKSPQETVTVGTGHTDSHGRLHTEVVAPRFLDAGDDAVIMVSTYDGRFRALADPVRVPDARYASSRGYSDGYRGDFRPANYDPGDEDNDDYEQGGYFKVGEKVSIDGVVTPEGEGECAAVRNAAGRLFSITGEQQLKPGDRVRIDGRVAPSDWCDKGIAIAAMDVDFDHDRGYSSRPRSRSIPYSESDYSPRRLAPAPARFDNTGLRSVDPAPSGLGDTNVVAALSTDAPREVIRGVVTAENSDCTTVRAFDGTVYGIPARLTSVSYGEGIELIGSRAGANACRSGITFIVDQARKL